MKRLVILPTTDHGPVTLTEPGWCTGHADYIPGYRVDLTHSGTRHDLTFDGLTIMDAMLSQYPEATNPDQRRTGLYIEQVGYASTFDPAEVRQFAATLVTHAAYLRRLADQLAVIQAEEGGR
ncbi:DUF6907 domain-containing protein [Streptomyces sp. NPDC088757]|uniref:DUF6907 domain-containing protein n=1 Tax=Streptomyces sp. NPDC088757 TaxID=3365889 RepID=UPI003814EF01